jgi:hypothetical protein
VLRNRKDQVLRTQILEALHDPLVTATANLWVIPYPNSRHESRHLFR